MTTKEFWLGGQKVSAQDMANHIDPPARIIKLGEYASYCLDSRTVEIHNASLELSDLAELFTSVDMIQRGLEK